MMFRSVPNDIAFMVAFLRMENAYFGSVDISQKNAKTVTLFKGLFPSYGLYNRSQPGPGNELYAIQETNGSIVVPWWRPVYIQ